MALSKEFDTGSGIILSYHRIDSLQIVVNSINLIAVLSYPSEQVRVNQKNLEDKRKDNTYMETRVYEADYDETMNIVSAYEYLKTLPEFEGATDI